MKRVVLNAVVGITLVGVYQFIMYQIQRGLMAAVAPTEEGLALRMLCVNVLILAALAIGGSIIFATYTIGAWAVEVVEEQIYLWQCRRQEKKETAVEAIKRLSRP